MLHDGHSYGSTCGSCHLWCWSMVSVAPCHSYWNLDSWGHCKWFDSCRAQGKWTFFALATPQSSVNDSCWGDQFTWAQVNCGSYCASPSNLLCQWCSCGWGTLKQRKVKYEPCKVDMRVSLLLKQFDASSCGTAAGAQVRIVTVLVPTLAWLSRQEFSATNVSPLKGWVLKTHPLVVP